MAEPEATPVKEVSPPPVVAPVPYWTYLIPIGIAAIGMFQVLGLAVIGYLMSGVKQDSKATAESTEKIHVAVNSERKVLTDELREVKNANKELASRVATLLERLSQQQK